jgi:hypothetical protein
VKCNQLQKGNEHMEDDLLHEIMNLPCKPPVTFPHCSCYKAYEEGHKEARRQAAELLREVVPEPTPAAPALSGTLFIRSDDRNYAAAREEESRTYPKVAPTPTQPVAMIEPADARRLADELEQLRRDHWPHWSAQENNIAATAVRHLRLLAEEPQPATPSPIDWGAVDAELLRILGRYWDVAYGQGREGGLELDSDAARVESCKSDLRALLRKVSRG